MSSVITNDDPTPIVSLQNYPRRKEQVISQKASSNLLLLNMSDGNYYSLNEVGSKIWELCDGNHSIAQLVDALTAEYDAPAETLKGDILELLDKLRSEKLIVEAVKNGPDF